MHSTINILYYCMILSFSIIQLMLDSWNQSIFNDIKQRLQDAAMRLVRAERNGEAFDSQLVIGVRESYGNEQNISTNLLQQNIFFNY